MDIHRLRLVLAICECGSIGKAARELRVSQPTLSKTLARLEDQLGQVLFQRGRGDSATPTIFALHVADRAREILRWTDRLDREISLLAGGEAGRVRMGVGPGAKVLMLPQLITEILRRFPQLHLDLDVLASDELHDRLSEGQFDLIVGHFSPFLESPGMQIVPLFEEPGASIVRAGHPLDGREALTWTECLAHPHVSTVRYKTYAPFFSEGLPPEAEQIFTTVRTSDMDCARALIVERDFVGLASPFIFMDEIASGEFVILPLPRRYRSACSVAVTQEAAHFPVILQIIELIKQCATDRGLTLL